MSVERRQSDVEIALLRKDMDEMKSDMRELKTQVSGLLEAWNTATGLVKFVKWLAGAVTAAGVLYALLKDHVR